jgi:hypothetical protein
VSDMRLHASPQGDGGGQPHLEDVKRAAYQNGTTVDEILTTITGTTDKDRAERSAEYK